MTMAENRFLLYFILVEAFLFGTFFGTLAFERSSGLAGLFYGFYVYITPVLLLGLCLTDPALRDKLRSLIVSSDLIILIVVIIGWGIAWLYLGLSPWGLFFPYAFIDELNFRFVFQNKISAYAGRGRAVILQAIAFTALYSSYVIFETAGYPGLFLPLFFLDMFGMGMLYGALYYLRGNIYSDIAIHISLYAMIPLLPAYLGFIPYSLLPT